MAYNLTPEQYNRLHSIMTEQVETPARAIVNPEAAFVRSKLGNCGEGNLAIAYWSWVVHGHPSGVFPPEIDELQRKLKQIDQTAIMPAWGTKGT